MKHKNWAVLVVGLYTALTAQASSTVTLPTIQTPGTGIAVNPIPSSSSGGNMGTAAPANAILRPFSIAADEYLNVTLSYTHAADHNMLAFNISQLAPFQGDLLIKAFHDDQLLGEHLKSWHYLKSAFVNHGVEVDFAVTPLTIAGASILDINRLEIYPLLRPEDANEVTTIEFLLFDAGIVSPTSWDVSVGTVSAYGRVVSAVPDVSALTSMSMGLLGLAAIGRHP